MANIQSGRSRAADRRRRRNLSTYVQWSPNGTVALVDRRARLADDVWVVWSDRSVEFVECCRDAAQRAASEQTLANRYRRRGFLNTFAFGAGWSSPSQPRSGADQTQPPPRMGQRTGQVRVRSSASAASRRAWLTAPRTGRYICGVHRRSQSASCTRVGASTTLTLCARTSSLGRRGGDQSLCPARTGCHTDTR
jgi:hypothetical protein